MKTYYGLTETGWLWLACAVMSVVVWATWWSLFVFIFDFYLHLD